MASKSLQMQQMQPAIIGPENPAAKLQRLHHAAGAARKLLRQMDSVIR